MRIIGFEIHRAFAEAVAWEDGKLRRLGRVDMCRNLLTTFATTLSREDIVVVEATGNAAAVASVIGPHLKRVVIATPIQLRMTMPKSRRTPSTPACWRSSTPAAFFRKFGSRMKRRRPSGGRSPAAIRSFASVRD